MSFQKTTNLNRPRNMYQPKHNYDQLRVIGLTKLEVKIYSYLNEYGLATSYTLTKTLSANRTNIYRNLNKLMKIGLITEISVGLRPSYFKAIYIEEALYLVARYHYQTLQPLIIEQRLRKTKLKNLNTRGRGRAGGNS